MDMVISFLIQWGYWGMLLSAFLAGSVFPFSSEAVMLGLLAAGLDPWQLVVYGTAGNVLGSVFNYGVGMLGRMDWIERYLHVSADSMERARRFMNGRGAWMGFFAFVPLLGSDNACQHHPREISALSAAGVWCKMCLLTLCTEETMRLCPSFTFL